MMLEPKRTTLHGAEAENGPEGCLLGTAGRGRDGRGRGGLLLARQGLWEGASAQGLRAARLLADSCKLFAVKKARNRLRHGNGS